MQVLPAQQKSLADAHRALKQKHYQRAHSLAMGVLQENPEPAEAYFIMALIAHQHDNVIKAADVVVRALSFDPGNTDYRLFQAQCMLELNRTEQAREVVAGIAGQEVVTAHQSDMLGVLHSRLGQHAAALDYFRRACGLQPNDANYQYNLASCAQFSGLFDEAEAAYEKAIALQPDHYRSHSSLSQLRRQGPEHNHIDRLLSLWHSLDSDVDARLHVGHALSKEYEDLGNYRLAMQYLVEAKREKHRQVREDAQDDIRLFSALRRMPERLTDLQDEGFPTGEPIFIVGMPRTGTTLVERILSSHAQVESAGELANFSLLVKRQLRTGTRWVLDAETIDQAHNLDFERLGRDYIESTRHLTGHCPHFIDKMPLNFMYVPLIAKALPGARIICLRRNPMDTCLSNFRQLFATRFSYYNYSYSLRDTAEFYARFHELMNHFAEWLGDRFYQVHYENVVAEPEKETRSLLHYCGLPWDSRCLEFDENQTPVATASSVQVREKIYHRALQRWRHYEPWLGEADSVFEEHGIAYR